VRASICSTSTLPPSHVTATQALTCNLLPSYHIHPTPYHTTTNNPTSVELPGEQLGHYAFQTTIMVIYQLVHFNCNGLQTMIMVIDGLVHSTCNTCGRSHSLQKFMPPLVCTCYMSNHISSKNLLVHQTSPHHSTFTVGHASCRLLDLCCLLTSYEGEAAAAGLHSDCMQNQIPSP